MYDSFDQADDGKAQRCEKTQFMYRVNEHFERAFTTQPAPPQRMSLT
jgi:hypothetical protein